MLKFLTKILGIALSLSLIFPGNAFAERTASTPFYYDGSGNWIMSEATDELGSSADRIAKIWAADGDFTTITFGTFALGFTEGSITFADASGNLAQDNANFFWDDTNNRLGLGVTDPDEQLEITGRVHMQQIAAPGTTTDKLYNLGGTLYWDGTDLTAGGGGTPGGIDTQVQFNDGGSFGGDAGMVYNKTTDVLTVNSTDITGGTNTFTVTNGSAALDVAAGANMNIDASLNVESASLIDQDLTADASVTFAGMALGAGNLTMTGSIAATGSRITKLWATDLEVTNAIAGSITGNAATVSTITGLAPDTATTAATQGSITSAANLVTVGALDAGSITANFGAIDVGASNIDGAVITADTNFAGDLTGNVTGNTSGSAGTVATITGLAPDTATTQATQPNITTAAGLPWTGMKVGTDGEIPTFDASGNPAFVAVGTATEVLTSNGIGVAPTFQAAGGGGGASQFDAEICASGCDYTTIDAAVADSKVSLLVSGDITEDTDTDVPAGGIYIYINNDVTVTVGNFAMIIDTATDYVTVQGADRYTSKIDITGTDSSNAFIDCSNDDGKVVLRDLFIDNNSATTYYVVDNNSVDAINIVLEINHFGGFSNMEPGSHFDNMHIIGTSGDASSLFTGIRGLTYLSNIRLTGTFNSTSWGSNTGGPVYFDNFNFGSITTKWTAQGLVHMKDVTATGGTVDVSAAGAAHSTFDNVHLLAVDLTDSDAHDLKFTDSIIIQKVSSDYPRNRFNSVTFLGGADVGANAEDVGFSLCQFGADAGGGTNDLNIESGATRTRVIGSMGDAVIVDNGTDTVDLGNTLY